MAAASAVDQESPVTPDVAPDRAEEAPDRTPDGASNGAPDGTSAGPGDEAPPGAHAGFRLALLGTLVLALLAAAGCLVWLLAERRGAAEEEQAARTAVLRQAEQFVLRLNTYGPDQLDDQGRLPEYASQVTEVITAKFAADFEKSGLPIAEQTVAQAGYGRSAQLRGAGVESLDGDAATVIVAATLTGSSPDPQHPKDPTKRVDADPAVLRWQVELVRGDDGWLVDDYAPVGEEAR